MLGIVIGFLVISLLLYCLLGGADFGAGVLEIFLPKKYRQQHEDLINKAMGPVWEANHIWLIILIVILFNGFPKIYTELSIYFHVPLTIMLIGIVFRGCAFTFRHYDAIKDGAHQYYSFIFSWASILTPLMFGMIIGGMMTGVNPDAGTYYQKYIVPWYNPFSLSCGFFVLSAFTYLASVYLIGEAQDLKIKANYIKYAKIANIVLLATGALVFSVADWERYYFLRLFFTNPVSLSYFVLASISVFIFWMHISKGEVTHWDLRFIAGMQIAFVFLAWGAAIFPDALFYSQGNPLSLFGAAAPTVTLNVLAWSLIIGSLVFLPILFYLIFVFKVKG